MSGDDGEILTSRSTAYMCGVIDSGHSIGWPDSGDISFLAVGSARELPHVS